MSITTMAETLKVPQIQHKNMIIYPISLLTVKSPNPTAVTEVMINQTQFS